MLKIKSILQICISVAVLSACAPQKKASEQTVKQVIDDAISRLYETKSAKELESLTEDETMALFSEEQLNVLATRHWMFDVNVPVTVSVIRSTKQEVVPFWLSTSGFQKTDLTLKNEMATYEIWQKKFDAGTVHLGINGFDNYRLHYFVAVKTQNEGDDLQISHLVPADQPVTVLQDSVTTYNDWTELVTENVPGSLLGARLLTTIRGRGSESNIVGAFRETAFPSSDKPDQLMLTWSGDPATTIDIQWRTNRTVESGSVSYRELGATKEQEADAEKFEMEDRNLVNDRFINRFTARLAGLTPGQKYQYLIAPETDWEKADTFETADQSDKLSFIWTGDTHHSPVAGEVANKAYKAHPDAKFISFAGDLVSDGTDRDQWDDLWQFTGNVIKRIPLMSVPGNHDERYGLGAEMYRNLFSYPKNGPDSIPSEQTYAFTYNNALFLMIDGVYSTDLNTKWIEDQLKNSDAKWKFAMFHFPPYNWEEPYLDMQQAWVPLFDKYHVDMVFGGHIHYYMRSKPMNGGKVVKSYNEGTAYIISLAIMGQTDPEKATEEPYAEKREFANGLYQYINIDGDNLTYESVNLEGKIIDSFSINKSQK